MIYARHGERGGGAREAIAMRMIDVNVADDFCPCNAVNTGYCDSQMGAPLARGLRFTPARRP
jgi:hypothetical protein